MTEMKHAQAGREGNSPKTLWAYAYEILPPQRNDLMKEIAAFLSEEHSNAKRLARTWTGRMVREQQVTHILVVCDDPDQSSEVNHRLEARLERLKARYSLSAPLAITDEEPATSPDGTMKIGRPTE